MSIFTDHAVFMRACNQIVGDDPTADNYGDYAAQANLYLRLIDEEVEEVKTAMLRDEFLKELTDLLVVTVGAMLTEFTPEQCEQAWREVLHSNYTKIGDDGKVKKRADGKVLKPTWYVEADMPGVINGKIAHSDADVQRWQEAIQKR